jgi:uncharacterized membrane protein
MSCAHEDMASVEHSIEVNVPVTTAYNQWTQFESFPQFMEGVREVHQLDDKHLHWRAEIAGQEREWDAEITEQIPDERIAWTSRAGVNNGGVVTFHRLDPSHTKIMLQMEYEPSGATEKIGDAMGLVTGRVKGSLDRFKEFVESRRTETGAWRGEIKRDPVQGEPGRVIS